MMGDKRHIERLRSKTSVEVLWPYILALCEKEPVYAYEIRQMIHERFGFGVGQVTAYMVLYKMESQGLVSTKWIEVAARQRKYYFITSEGEKSLRRAREVFESVAKSLSG